MKIRSVWLTLAFSSSLLMLGPSISLAAPTLTTVVDVPLSGRASRFDYQSFDPTTQRLYFTHMGDGELVVFDTAQRKEVAHLSGFPTDTGVLVVPSLHRIFVSVAGRREIAVVDTDSLQVLARIPAEGFPDGLAYAPDAHKVFVSDESGGREIVIDTNTLTKVGTIRMGGEVGNTQYNPASGHILANVQNRKELVEIDPQTDTIIARHPLTGCRGPHGLLIRETDHLAFAACEDDAKLLVIDLDSFQVKQVLDTGDDPDVLAFDPGLQRLYVATESNIVSVFHLDNGTLSKLEDLVVARRAHTVSVNPANHEVYMPLQNIDGHPVLRILRP